jgi:hypothetical protein
MPKGRAAALQTQKQRFAISRDDETERQAPTKFRAFGTAVDISQESTLLLKANGFKDFCANVLSDNRFVDDICG